MDLLGGFVDWCFEGFLMAVQDRRKNSRRHDATSVPVNRRAQDRRTHNADRREDIRVPLELWMEEIVGKDVYFRRTGNVSPGGVYFDNAIPHIPGTEITLKFTLPGDRELVVARGKVVNPSRKKNADLGMSIKFISIEGDGKARIKSFIQKTA